MSEDATRPSEPSSGTARGERPAGDRQAAERPSDDAAGPRAGSPGAPAESRPTLAIRTAGWTLVVALALVFVAWPLMEGRFYGTGQVLFYCFLIALGAWIVHWTHRVVRREGDRIVLASPVHVRKLRLEGMRAEIRIGWWTRIVLAPAFGISTALLRPFWQPDPEVLLRAWLPEDAVLVDETPTFGGPGPEEREDHVTE